MKPQLRELREDVENNNYDKRRKAGEDSYDLFKAGTRFLLSFEDADSAMAGLPRTARLVEVDLDGNRTLISGTLVKLFYASSTEVQPQSIADLVAIHGVDHTSVLKELFASNWVKLELIEQVMLHIIEQRRLKAEERAKKKDAQKMALMGDEAAPVTSSNDVPPIVE